MVASAALGAIHTYVTIVARHCVGVGAVAESSAGYCLEGSPVGVVVRALDLISRCVRCFPINHHAGQSFGYAKVNRQPAWAYASG